MIRLADLTTRGMRALRSRGRDESGYSLPELSVAIIVGTAVLGGLFVLVNFATRSNARTTSRVAVDQIARPAMQRIIDELHSTCVYPGIAPVLSGSSDTQISMLQYNAAVDRYDGGSYNSGTDASPVPVVRRITFTQQTGTNPPAGPITDYAYQVSGTAPNWTATTTVLNRATLINRAVRVPLTSSTSVPIFRYYRYVNGAISTTPLPTPLSSENAKLVVQVTVTFMASLSAGATRIDPDNAVTLTDSALLRFSPSNEDTNKAGLPCT